MNPNITLWYNKEVIMFNKNIVFTSFMSDTRQLFTEGNNAYVWFMDESKLVKMKPDAYLILLLKLSQFVSMKENYDI